ncbi:MAG: response regulator transcription factor [Candidatus Omnitrophota bacterium]
MIKLLVVDDEPGLCFLLQKQFSLTGFTVFTATNGRDALQLVRKEKPKIVFLDIKMLGMTGLETLMKIKEISKDIKVIMVSVVDDEKTRERAKDLGADKFIAKPFMNEELEEAVTEMVWEIKKNAKA